MNVNALAHLHRLEFYESKLMVDIVTMQCKKHKNKRINKKWIKRYGYIQIEKPSRKYYVMGNSIIAHPEMIERMKLALANAE